MPPKKANDDKVSSSSSSAFVTRVVATDYEHLLACPVCVRSQTFGMKNKKGGKAQKMMNTISKQTATSGKNKEDVSTPEILLCLYRHGAALPFIQAHGADV